MTEASATPAPLPRHVEALELALRLLLAAGRAAENAPAGAFDLRPAGKHVGRAIGRAFEAYDGHKDPITATVESMASCDDARAAFVAAAKADPGLAHVPEWLEKARGWLAVAADRFRAIHVAPATSRTIRASARVPALHAPARTVVEPSHRIAAPLPPPPDVDPPETIDSSLPLEERMQKLRARADARRSAAEARDKERLAALRASREKPKPAELVPGFVPGAHAALSREAFAEARARELLEEVAMTGLHRTPILGDAWRSVATFDDRMLTAIDALATLGKTTAGMLEGWVIDAPAKDPSRAFGVAMVAGSFEGRDVLGAVERAARFIGFGEPATQRMLASALKICPNPHVISLARTWLGDDEAALRAVALEVLAHRGLTTPEDLRRALEDEAPEVLAVALIEAAYANLPDLQTLVAPLATHTHPDVVAALAWSMVLGDVPHAVARLAERIGDASEDAVLVPLALAGEASDVARLVEITQKKATGARATALGFAGCPGAIEALIAVLRTAKDDALKLSAAFALDRITDAGMIEDVALPPENLEVEEPPDPETPDQRERTSLARAVSDPRDAPSDGSPDTMSLPSTRPEPWMEFVASRAERFRTSGRVRRGEAYRPALSFRELADLPVTPGERRILHREIVIKTGRHVRFDPNDFVSVQETSLAAIAEHVSGAGPANGFGRARRRAT